jgi:hypothetical protein
MGVYEILAIGSLVLGFSAFNCAQIVIVLLLRRRFIGEKPLVPLQQFLQYGLYGGFVLGAGVWIIAFVICARAVLRETIAGNIVPLPLFAFVLACAFAGLITVSWFSLRYREKELEALADEFEETAKSRGGLHLVPPRSSLSDSEPAELKKKARKAVLYFGASIETLQRDREL